jgi:two-component system nitrate/nitrite sensor histidine kinase NarX
MVKTLSWRLRMMGVVSLDEIPGSSRYGLRGMRERADLIGAEFQVISRKGEGTDVNIRLPFSIGEAVE